MQNAWLNVAKSKFGHAAFCLAIATTLCGHAQAAPAAKPAAKPDNHAAPGDLVIDHPTLINLGFEWLIKGDDNRNARVAVAYRKLGDSAWKDGMDFLRLHGERIYQKDSWDLVEPNMFAGSVLDLEPGTKYEVRMTLTDPDGLAGGAKSAVKTVTVATRPEPEPATGGRVFHVYPTGFKGSKLEPSFPGIMCAYNTYCGGGDTTTTARPRVRPGDIVLVHAGLYKYHPEYYGPDKNNNVTSPIEGTYYLNASGTPDKPIVIKAAGDGEVILDGGGNFNLFNMKMANYNYVEGLTFRNTTIAIWGGTEFQQGAKGLTIKHNRFENVAMGVFANYAGSSDFYIADNTFIGRDDPSHMIAWSGAYWKQFDGVDGQKFPPTMASYIAVKVAGPGHVVAYNYVANFHDGIDTETYGNPDGSSATEGPQYPPRQYWDRRTNAIDYYNNYMTNFHDNAFEIDGSLHNIRVMRNMIVNSANEPMCNQPGAGGPIYWIRNIMYHAPDGATRMSDGAAGVIFLNNTILTEVNVATSANNHWANNLIMGQGAQPAIFRENTYTNYSTSDYNGFRVNSGAPYSFQWNSPPFGVEADYSDLLSAGDDEGGGPPAARGDRKTTLVTRQYATLAEYAAATHQDTHSVAVDYDVFVNVPKLDKNPATVQRLYDAKDFDFNLKPGSAAVDKGKVIANVTDGYAGTAPDLGALEVGQAMPHYGPRM